MATGRPVVGVGVEPFLFRSAIHAALRRDGRLEPVLVPAGADPTSEAARTPADAWLLSRPADLRATPVVLLSHAPPSIEVRREGRDRSVPYRELGPVADLLVAECEHDASAASTPRAASGPG